MIDSSGSVHWLKNNITHWVKSDPKQLRRNTAIKAYPGEVLLTDHVLMGLDILGVLGNPDAAPLAARLGLEDVRLVLLLATVGLVVTVTGNTADRTSHGDIIEIMQNVALIENSFY